MIPLTFDAVGAAIDSRRSRNLGRSGRAGGQSGTIEFTNSVDIDRPMHEVRAYLADLENTPEWNIAITGSRKVTPGPAGVGTRYEQTREAPRRSTETIEITTLEPTAVEVTGTLAGLPARLEYRLAPTKSGTRLVNDVHLQVAGMAGLAATVAQSRIRGAVADNLERLKSILEGQRALIQRG